MDSNAAETAFKKKQARRRRLAKLPFERKIEIVVELQRLAAEIRKDPRRKAWEL